MSEVTTRRQVAVVTGASSGIGAVYADRLARRGFDLVLVARRADRLRSLADELAASTGARVDVVAADLTRGEDLARIEALLATDPRITLLVNNAGNGKIGTTRDMRAEDAASTIALNVTALTHLTKAVLPAFLARNEGTIVNVASVLALHALPMSSLYAGTKAFVLNFSRGLQQELSGSGVKVQVVLPAGTATEFYDQSGVPLSAFDPSLMMSAEDLVDAALAGLDRGEAVTMPSVQDLALWETYDDARTALFAATQTGAPAARYRAA